MRNGNELSAVLSVGTRPHSNASHQLTLLGLTGESRRVIAELQGSAHEGGSSNLETSGDGGDADLDWEMVPEDTENEETFSCAMRDILGVRYDVQLVPLRLHL